MAPVPPARHLLRAKDLGDARYCEPLTVADLADAAGLSRAYFSEQFRRAFGESPHAHLLTRRLGRAAALLRTTDRSVADICVGVGLQSIGSFTTSFTRMFRNTGRFEKTAHSHRISVVDPPTRRGGSDDFDGLSAATARQVRAESPIAGPIRRRDQPRYSAAPATPTTVSVMTMLHSMYQWSPVSRGQMMLTVCTASHSAAT